MFNKFTFISFFRIYIVYFNLQLLFFTYFVFLFIQYYIILYYFAKNNLMYTK